MDLNPEHGQNYEIGYKFQNEKWSAGVIPLVRQMKLTRDMY